MLEAREQPSRRPLRRSAAAALVAVALLAAPVPAAASDSHPVGDQVFDAVVLRPLGFLGTTVGFALFVCSLPLSGPTLQVDVAWDRFVQQPGDFTFHRPLGDF